MGEAIEQLDSQLTVNSQELQKVQHYKVACMHDYSVYVCIIIILLGCGDAEKQF